MSGAKAGAKIRIRWLMALLLQLDGVRKGCRGRIVLVHVPGTRDLLGLRRKTFPSRVRVRVRIYVI